MPAPKKCAQAQQDERERKLADAKARATIAPAFPLRPSRDEIVGAAIRLLTKVRERGIRTSESDHPMSGACQQQRCMEPHLLGHSGNVSAFSGDDWLEGQYFEVFGEWNIHGARYDRIYAYFPGLLSRGTSVDVSLECLHSQTQ